MMDEHPQTFETKVLVSLARIEGALSSVDAQGKDHEVRLRLLEARKTVSPTTLWTTIASIIATLGVVLKLFPISS